MSSFVQSMYHSVSIVGLLQLEEIDPPTGLQTTKNQWANLNRHNDQTHEMEEIKIMDAQLTDPTK